MSWRRKTHDLVKQMSNDYRRYWEEMDSCPICNSKNFKSFGTFFELRYVECEECDHLFGLDQLDEEGLALLYSSDISASGIYIDEEKFQKRVQSIASPKVEFVTKNVPGWGKGGGGAKWLDVGASVGEILLAAKQKGWTTVGLETDPTAVAFARRLGLEVEETYVTKDNAEKYLADVQIVSVLNVLEHLKSPQSLLQALAKGLENKSWLLVEVPRHPSLTGFAMKTMPEHAVRYIFAQHLHLFSEKSLNIILEKSRFLTKAIWFFGQDFYEMLSILCMTHNTDIPSNVLQSVSTIQQSIDACNLSDVMLILAQLDK